jgi:hypothetical protein
VHRRRRGTTGRPSEQVGPAVNVHQAALFATRWVTHLRTVHRIGEREPRAVDRRNYVVKHLRDEAMRDWIPAVQTLHSYLQRDDASWGEQGVVSATRWRDDVQYQAVRRLLAHRLQVNQRSLRRRFDERQLWGSLRSE